MKFHTFEKNVIIFRISQNMLWNHRHGIIITTVSIIFNIVDIHIGLGGRIYENNNIM